MATKEAVIHTRLKELQNQIITHSMDIDNWDCRNANFKDFGEYEYINDNYTVSTGDIWARSGQTAFLKNTIEIPDDWAGEYIAFEFLTGGEGLLSVNGKPYHGVDDNRGYIRLLEKAKGNEKISLEIEIKTGGYWEYEASNTKKPYILHSSKLIAVNKDIEAAFYDFSVPAEVAHSMKDELLKAAVYNILEECILSIDFKADRTSFINSLNVSTSVLSQKLSDIEWHKALGTAMYSGNSHIDVAWLWPLKETMRKVGRTYSTVTNLMEEFPEYYFNCSQVPLFKYLQKNFPTIYEQVKERVKEGRFECIGGTWVENDTNLVSGESLVRQCLYGQRFFSKEMGQDVKIGWLPDVFGYSYNLPQIYKKAGIDYFMTTKLTWNDTNKFPHQVFDWEGIDGSAITCFLSNTYVDNLDFPSHYHAVVDNYKDKLKCPDYLALFGWGDGGGGPTRANLEKIKRLKNAPGFPTAKTGKVIDFFNNSIKPIKDLPKWNGELYFEYHRGTYTSQADNKKLNRKSELKLRDAEIIASIAKDLGFIYPKEKLTNAWETVLLNQFHDIIPGSSINAVYKESIEQYNNVLSVCDEITDNAMAFICENTAIDKNSILVFNTLSHKRDDVIEIPWKNKSKNITITDPEEVQLPFQFEDDKLIIMALEIPPLGYKILNIKEGKAKSKPYIENPFEFGAKGISSNLFDIKFNEDGTLKSIWDIECEREVITDNARANLLQVFEDKPTAYDAWELEPEYMQKSDEFKIIGRPTLVYSGDVRCVVRSKYEYNKSIITQDMILYTGKGTIDFKTNVEWHEKNTLLKAAFPVDIRSNYASYEIAYGTITRSTTNNTSYDKAQFETSGHRFADLSETGFGVSILNDSKYGWDIKENNMRLSLLRSPVYPDPEADQGQHNFTYSLFPHSDNCLYDTIEMAHDLNAPLYTVIGDKPGSKNIPEMEFSYADVATENVIIDCIKECEDDNSVILRVYEPYGARGEVCIVFDKIPISCSEVNLLEEAIDNQKLEVMEDGQLLFYIKPYEIKTFKIVFANI